MEYREDITELFGQIAQLRQCAHKQDCSGIYARIGDRVMTALKTIIAHAHILAVKNEYSSPEAEEKYNLNNYIDDFLTVLLPPRDEDGEHQEQEYDEASYDREAEISMIRHAVPELMENYSDFSGLCAALETIEKILPHIDQWQENVNQNAGAADVDDIAFYFHDLASRDYEPHEVFYMDILERTSLKRLIENAKKSAERRLNSYDMLLFLPSEPN